ncbi:RNA polymerase sigma factor [Clostridia bacterium]|nr:RNA polymerase sigma factor [Clostridia bacterium]
MRTTITDTIVNLRQTRFTHKIFERLARTFSRTSLYINSPGTLPPPLTKDEEEEAFRLLATDFQRGRDLLITHNLRLVVYIAKKFDGTRVGLEDLISIGTIGLIKAVGTFSPDKNIKLATYASRCIENEILMFLRKSNQYKYEISIDEPLNVDWDGNELLLSDVLGTDAYTTGEKLESEVEKHMLMTAVKKLPERERVIMEMRFGLGGDSKKVDPLTGAAIFDESEEKTQKEVADAIGISQSYISRLEKRIIQRLQKEMARLT